MDWAEQDAVMSSKEGMFWEMNGERVFRWGVDFIIIYTVYIMGA
jgi:hypothetical protein